MRRLGLLAVWTAWALLLSGCTGWVGDSYVSVTPHQEFYGQQQPVDAVAVSDQETLQAVLLEYVEGRVLEATLDMSQYGNTLEQDVETVIDTLFQREPLVSYAVSRIRITPAEVGARRIATVNITYRRAWEQMQKIQNTWGLEGLSRRLGEALEAAASELTLQISGYRNADLQKLVNDYYVLHPDTVMECPQVTVAVYPDSGTTRILEMRFIYSQNQQVLLDMAKEVQIMLSSAEGYVRGQEEEQARAERLSSFLQPLLSGEGETSTPVYSLLHDGIYTSRTVAEVYELLCARVGLKCLVVEGTLDAKSHYWNILRLDGTYCHLDLTAAWDGSEFRYDEDMANYQWDTASYPPCPKPEPTDVQTGDPTEDPDGQQPPDESQPSDETEPTESIEPSDPPGETEHEATGPEG